MQPRSQCDARFDAAGADLLKLLIQPLYGDTPEVGIRELMQNSIDACLELQDYFAQGGPSVDLDEPDLSADVVITLEEKPDGSRYVTVADRGIGMTPSVVRDYFLKAGASFRRSDAWRRQHEIEPGRSRVLRSGRFGVGALAAFLLGDELEVSTRHVSVPKNAGVCFVARLESEEIQLNHCEHPVGTTVRVKISSDHVWNAIAYGKYWEDSKTNPNPLRQWDFYCTTGRRVERVLINNRTRVVLPQRLTFPAAGSALSPPWHRITAPDYQDVQWRNEPTGSKLICNGILVSDHRGYSQRKDWTPQGFQILRPTVSVFDPDGRLPLNLQRTDLATRDFPFGDALWESQCQDYIAWIFANAPSRPLVAPSDVQPEYGALAFPPPRLTFSFMREGSVPIELWAFQQISPARVIFFPERMKEVPSSATNELWVPLDLKWEASDARKAWFRTLFGWNIREGLSPFEAFRPRGRRTIIRTTFYEEIRQPRIIAKFVWDDIVEGPSNRRWTILSSGDCGSGRIDFTALLRSPATAGIDGLTEYFGVSINKDADEVRPYVRENRTWPIAAIWPKFAENVVIPYNLRRRKRAFPRAYDKLGAVISHYESLQKKKERQR